MSKMSTCANSNNQLASSGRFGQVLQYLRKFQQPASIKFRTSSFFARVDLNRLSTYPGANPQKGTVLCIIKLFNNLSCYDVTRIFAAFRARVRSCARTLVRNFHENLRHFAAFPKCADISRTVLHGQLQTLSWFANFASYWLSLKLQLQNFSEGQLPTARAW